VVFMVLNGLDKSVFVNQKIIDMEISGRARALCSGSCSLALALALSGD